MVREEIQDCKHCYMPIPIQCYAFWIDKCSIDTVVKVLFEKYSVSKLHIYILAVENWPQFFKCILMFERSFVL